MEKNIQIYVASHDENDIKKIQSDEIYIPFFVGRNGKDNLGFLSDDSGDNISQKNDTYCELTGLYWIWKHSNADIIGLAHYRRCFARWRFGKRLEKKDINEILQEYDIILPKRTSSLFDSVHEDYDHWNYIKDLDLCGEAIKKICPEYLNSYNKIVYGKELYCYNMFIASKDIIDEYCQWLFPILSEVEKNVDMTGYSDYQRRLYGFLAERLFDVWMEEQNLKVKECALKVNGLKYNIYMWVRKRWIVRQFYKKIYHGVLNKNKRK